MRNPVQLALAAVVVLLLAGTAVMYQRVRTTSAENAKLQNSELSTQTRYADAINEIAAIQDSLNAIALGQSDPQLVPADLDAERRLSETRGDMALARIAVLKAGIERTKQRIQALDTNLKKSGVQVAGLQRMVANLRKDVTEKEGMIAHLSTQVDSLSTQVTGLTAEVVQGQEAIREQTAVLDDTRRELGTIYYVMGSKKELKNQGVVVAKGGVLGLGKTLEPAGNLNESLFVPMNTDEQTVISIPSKGAKILSDQPVASYELQKIGDQLQLVIVDPREFRKVKHLVIVTT